MHGLLLVMYAITAGFTLSGIVANLYRLVTASSGNISSQIVRTMIMVIAGPNILLEAAIKRLTKKEWSQPLFWCVVAGIAYWSMALGLFALDIALSV